MRRLAEMAYGEERLVVLGYDEGEAGDGCYRVGLAFKKTDPEGTEYLDVLDDCADADMVWAGLHALAGAHRELQERLEEAEQLKRVNPARALQREETAATVGVQIVCEGECGVAKPFAKNPKDGEPWPFCKTCQAWHEAGRCDSPYRVPLKT